MKNISEYEFIIIGAGLSGATLAFTLKHQFHKKVLLIDNDYSRSASLVAAGIFNPVTGKRMTKTWMADELFPTLHSFYPETEKIFNRHFFYNHTVIKPFDNIAEQNDWIAKSANPEYKNYISVLSPQNDFVDTIKIPFGGIEIKQSGWLDCEKYLFSIKDYMADNQSFVSGKITNDNQGNISFNGEKLEIGSFQKVVFCEGSQAAANPLWEKLPWRLTKGEVVILESETNIQNHIFNKSVFICPTAQKNQYRAGATYIWDVFDNVPTQAGIAEIVKNLKEYYLVDFEIVKAHAEVRPTVERRRPFIGSHPKFSNLFIFNGFGSKTVSFAPYFSKHFAEHLLLGKELNREVEIIERFK